MKEEELLRQVIDRCKVYRLRTAHFRPALSASGRWHTAVQGDGKGWPDLVIVGSRGMLIWELKTDEKYPDADQKIWLAVLEAVGVTVAVRRPRDLKSGLIDRELSALGAIRQQAVKA